MDAIVINKSGQLEAARAPGDFEVLQNGNSRKISRFAYIATQSGPNPLPARGANPNAVPIPPPTCKPDQIRQTIVLVGDELALSFESIYQVCEAIKKFTASRQRGGLVAMMGPGAGPVASVDEEREDSGATADAVQPVWGLRLGHGRPHAPRQTALPTR